MILLCNILIVLKPHELDITIIILYRRHLFIYMFTNLFALSCISDLLSRIIFLLP